MRRLISLALAAALAASVVIACVEPVNPVVPEASPIAVQTAAPTVEPTPSVVPTPTATPEPTPAVAGIGDPVRIADHSVITVNKVTGYKGSGYVTVNPNKGNTVIAVLVTIEGIASEGADYNLLYATITDAEGFEYNPQVFPAKEPQLQSGDVAAGKTVKGWLTFEVPKKGALTFVWSPIFADPAEVVIR